MDYSEIARAAAQKLRLLDSRGNVLALDSLRLIDYVLELEQATGLHVPTWAVRADRFRAPELAAATLAELARTNAPPLVASGRTGEFRLSFLAESIWRLARAGAPSSALLRWAGYRMRGALDLPALERSLAEVVRRHDALRMTCAADEPVARIVPAGPFALVHLTAPLPEADRDQAAHRLAATALAQPMELAKGPLLRAAVVSTSGEEHYLFLLYHRIALDREAVALVLAELGALYGAPSPSPSPLPPPAVQFSDYARWERGWLDGEVLAHQLILWRAKLASCPPLRLSEAEPHPAGEWGSYSHALPAPLVRAMRAFQQSRAFSPADTMMAAITTILSHRTGQTRFRILSRSGDREPEIAQIVGSFATPVHVVVDLDGDPEFEQAVVRVRRAARTALKERHLAALDGLPSAVGDQVHLEYQAHGPHELALGDLTLSEIDLRPLLHRAPAPRSTFTLVWQLQELEDGFTVVIDYRQDRFGRDDIAALATGYERLLIRALNGPYQRLSTLRVLTS